MDQVKTNAHGIQISERGAGTCYSERLSNNGGEASGKRDRSTQRGNLCRSATSVAAVPTSRASTQPLRCLHASFPLLIPQKSKRVQLESPKIEEDSTRIPQNQRGKGTKVRNTPQINSSVVRLTSKYWSGGAEKMSERGRTGKAAPGTEPRRAPTPGGSWRGGRTRPAPAAAAGACPRRGAAPLPGGWPASHCAGSRAAAACATRAGWPPPRRRCLRRDGTGAGPALARARERESDERWRVSCV